MIKSKHRPFIIQTTLNEEEHALLKRQAASEGLSVTAWIRRTVMVALRQTRPEGGHPYNVVPVFNPTDFGVVELDTRKGKEDPDEPDQT